MTKLIIKAVDILGVKDPNKYNISKMLVSKQTSSGTFEEVEEVAEKLIEELGKVTTVEFKIRTGKPGRKQNDEYSISVDPPISRGELIQVLLNVGPENVYQDGSLRYYNDNVQIGWNKIYETGRPRGIRSGAMHHEAGSGRRTVPPGNEQSGDFSSRELQAYERKVRDQFMTMSDLAFKRLQNKRIKLFTELEDDKGVETWKSGNRRRIWLGMVPNLREFWTRREIYDWVFGDRSDAY